MRPFASTALLIAFILASAVLCPAAAQDLPAGPGKETVAAVCGGCHDINRIRIGYTPQGWHTVIQMMRNVHAPVPDDQWQTVEQYLVQSFPERQRPPAVMLPGAVKIELKQWTVPTPGSRPHDPMAARDGSIWWTGQLANTLGRVDPKTGAIREFTLKSTNTGPHGLAEDKDGSIWFTGNSLGLIGKLDPKTGTVTEFPLPDPAAKDPHTIIFDRGGIAWFTVQQGNMIGWLDPASGAIKLATMPQPKSRPYGLARNSRDEIFLVEFGANRIARIEKETLAVTEFALPDAAARPRRLAIGPDDAVWYTDFARGALGRLDPATGTVQEWASPSGPKSEPYGIVFTKGAVWYSESGAKPNTVVRFDPVVRTFQTWAIPGGGDIVRNMDVDRDGNPVLANSLTNEVTLVDVR